VAAKRCVELIDFSPLLVFIPPPLTLS
jgi:hypothetical protein